MSSENSREGKVEICSASSQSFRTCCAEARGGEDRRGNRLRSSDVGLATATTTATRPMLLLLLRRAAAAPCEDGAERAGARDDNECIASRCILSCDGAKRNKEARSLFRSKWGKEKKKKVESKKRELKKIRMNGSIDSRRRRNSRLFSRWQPLSSSCSRSLSRPSPSPSPAASRRTRSTTRRCGRTRSALHRSEERVEKKGRRTRTSIFNPSVRHCFASSFLTSLDLRFFSLSPFLFQPPPSPLNPISKTKTK